MKKIKLLSLLLAITLMLIGCSDKMTKDDIDGDNDFKYVNNGGFYLDNTGKAVEVSEANNGSYKIVEWYTEPMCSYCLMLEDMVSPYLQDIQADTTLIKYIALTFLGSTGVEDEVTYSDMMTAIWLSMAENDPELVGQYYHRTSKAQFLNELQVQANQDQYMADVYLVELGGQKWDEIVNDIPRFMEVSRNATEFMRRDKELASKTPDGRLTTPTVIVQGADKVLPLAEAEDLRPVFEEALK